MGLDTHMQIRLTRSNEDYVRRIAFEQRLGFKGAANLAIEQHFLQNTKTGTSTKKGKRKP